ncbi:peptidoglycan-binding domain-containing protein [Candidatus Methylomirabilis sp.]|uniref:peptidoglycan-binding domain-containing protein n=1 Tax=Candidatus Methylomirabilis sp. TaxID=2032687 RepID=UPI0030761E0C
MCYAHDMCYEAAGSDNQICDQALSATAIRQADGFSEPSGCYNLAWLIGSGLAAKFWGKEKNPVASRFIEVANFVWTLPLGIAAHLANGVNYDKYGLPKEQGTCYLNDKKELHNYILISEFEAHYREYAKGFKFFTRSDPGMKSVSLPVPIRGWEKSFMVFEVKKYLNYYGFSAGPANTVLDARAIEAIRRFKGQRSPAFDPQSLGPVWETLKSKYATREFSERRKDDLLNWAQKKARYNYID